MPTLTHNILLYLMTNSRTILTTCCLFILRLDQCTVVGKNETAYISTGGPLANMDE